MQQTHQKIDSQHVCISQATYGAIIPLHPFTIACCAMGGSSKPYAFDAGRLGLCASRIHFDSCWSNVAPA